MAKCRILKRFGEKFVKNVGMGWDGEDFKFGFIGESAWLPRPCIQIWGWGPKSHFLYATRYQISWPVNIFS